ncbi:MAG: translation elongation factor Ts [Planctomycetes bacterium]|nr:translation elongation factor Ts [Planctomycetota bacterium]
MTEIDAKTVMELRRQTGAPMMECKAALAEAKGDMKLAVDVLRKRGIKAAEGRMGREAKEGLIFSYIHHNGKLGVLAELTCETDFVARNEEFQKFGKDLCLHIAAMKPRYLNREEIDAGTLAKEREILTEQTKTGMPGKPAEVVAKAVEGKIAKFFQETCLLDQPWVHDEKVTVDTVAKSVGAKTGENVQIRRFVRMELGG